MRSWYHISKGSPLTHTHTCRNKINSGVVVSTQSTHDPLIVHHFYHPTADFNRGHTCEGFNLSSMSVQRTMDGGPQKEKGRVRLEGTLPFPSTCSFFTQGVFRHLLTPCSQIGMRECSPKEGPVVHTDCISSTNSLHSPEEGIGFFRDTGVSLSRVS